MTILTEDEKKLVLAFYSYGWRSFEITERILLNRPSKLYCDINREILQIIADTIKKEEKSNDNR